MPRSCAHRTHSLSTSSATSGRTTWSCRSRSAIAGSEQRHGLGRAGVIVASGPTFQTAWTGLPSASATDLECSSRVRIIRRSHSSVSLCSATFRLDWTVERDGSQAKPTPTVTQGATAGQFRPRQRLVQRCVVEDGPSMACSAEKWNSPVGGALAPLATSPQRRAHQDTRARSKARRPAPQFYRRPLVTVAYPQRASAWQ
jgi:hypothetical protein